MGSAAHNIFIATVGGAPQVVTLTLDALLARGLTFDRVIVVHTQPDRDPVRGSLALLRDEFLTRRAYGDGLIYAPHLLTGARGPLSDVTTPDEIDDAFHSLYSLFRQHKQAGYGLHLCIAGGRKTLPILAIAAAQALFDHDDTVWHVVSPSALTLSKALHAEPGEPVMLVPLPIAYWQRMQPSDHDKGRDFLLNVLSPAEREVAELLLREGLSNAALAARLGKSIKTVSNQLSSIYEKLTRHYTLPEPADRAAFLVLLGRSS